MMFGKLQLLVLICALGSGVSAQTRQLTHFEEVTGALFRGEKVRVVIHYAQCVYLPEGSRSETPPDAVTGMDIDTYEYFAAGAIPGSPAFFVFSQSKLISNPRGKGFVINYGKVRVNSDDSVVVTARYLHPKNHRILMDEQFRGILNDGSNQGGIYFYVNGPKR